MVTSLSASQRQALAGMMDITEEMDTVNTRIQTNKSVNSILDGPAAFLQAERLNNRSSNLLGINKSIDLSLSAVTAAQAGLDKIKKDLNDKLTDLKSLQGTTQGAGSNSSVTVENIAGVTKTATGEIGTLSGQQSVTYGRQAIAANRKVFGSTTATAPSSQSDGSLGVAATGANGLKVDILTAAGTTAAASVTFQGSDSSTGNINDLTLGDVVKKLNNTAIGSGATLSASIDSSGNLQFASSVATGTAPAFKLRFGNSQQSTDYNSNFGIGAFVSTTAPTSTTVSTTSNLGGTVDTLTPPGLSSKLISALPSRGVFDTDTDSTNNGVSWNSAAGTLNAGTLGITQGNTLAVRITPRSGASTTLTVNLGDLSANTMAGLVTALNGKASTAGLSNSLFSIDSTSGNIKLRAALGTTLSFGQGSDSQTATNNAVNNTALTTAFGFAAGQSASGSGADFITDASGLSMVGLDSGSFQSGDMFSFKVTDTTTGIAKTAYFKAVDSGNNISANAGIDGLSQDRPQTFNTMTELQAAVNKVFNTSEVQVNLVRSGATGNNPTSYQLQLALGVNSALEIKETANAGIGVSVGYSNGVAQIKNNADSLTQIFGQRTNTNAGALNSTYAQESLLSSTDIRDVNNNLTGRRDDYGMTLTFVRNPIGSSTTADPKRVASAAALAKMLDTIDETVNNASVDGQKNVLLGNSVDVVTDDKGSVVSLALGQTISAANLGFTLAPAGNTYSLLAGNLGTDTDLNLTINAVQAAISKLEGFRSSLAGQSGILVNTKDYNAAISKTLGDAAANITKSDSTADAIEMKSLDTRYTLATSSVGILNNASSMAARMMT